MCDSSSNFDDNDDYSSDKNVVMNCLNTCIGELIRSGSNLDITDQNSQTALIVGHIEGHIECTDTLIKAGANINVSDNKGQTPVMKATIHGRLKCLQNLITVAAMLILQINLVRLH